MVEAAAAATARRLRSSRKPPSEDVDDESGDFGGLGDFGEFDDFDEELEEELDWLDQEALFDEEPAPAGACAWRPGTRPRRAAAGGHGQKMLDSIDGQWWNIIYISGGRQTPGSPPSPRLR